MDFYSLPLSETELETLSKPDLKRYLEIVYTFLIEQVDQDSNPELYQQVLEHIQIVEHILAEATV